MSDLKHITRADIDSMSKVPRLKLINSLPGFKSANLVGTSSKEGTENLAIFSSVMHLGSNPPLLGCILRPTTVPRHTYDNIRENDGCYTINHVNSDIYQQAHQTSGNYREDISEFESSGLTPWYSEGCPAPYVEESRIRIGLRLVEEHVVKANKTRLLVGAIEEVWVHEASIREDFTIDIEQAGSVAISGVDGYHTTKQIDQLDYVRIDEKLQRPGL
ncbi:flavin reductase family protein [Aliifodinibius sp. S!AR15-10]|uniref:flavin reductase family protein n=1 Tax=Aliifodinibius sp. S!AR15-10 TaxID=2950437 RepID=UPI002861590D|nr:flavin reductase family protein [Aliifodinibius sp. S!AR15-10]MDR8391705.1 flavin reductase family protein [Aliifodinibius sp. S!AR15-10]